MNDSRMPISKSKKISINDKNCAVTKKITGQVVNLFAQTFVGTPDFNVQFWRQLTNNPASRTNLGTVQTTTGTDIPRHNYIVQDSDIDIEDFGATVTDSCSTTNTVEEYCTISLNPFTNISISPVNPTIYIGQQIHLIATCDSPTCPTLTWESSNINIATVSTSGLVTASSTNIGTTTISAKDLVTGIIGTTVVTVTDIISTSSTFSVSTSLETTLSATTPQEITSTFPVSEMGTSTGEKILFVGIAVGFLYVILKGSR